MNKTVTSDFGNFVLMTNMHEAPRLYEVINLQDEKTSSGGSAAGTNIGKSRVINFAFESGNVAGDSSTIYRANLIDTQFYTILTTSGSATGTEGDLITGSTSGATGFLVGNVSGTSTTLYGTNGTFVSGESLTKSGASYGTISAVKTYGFNDVKQYKFTTGGGTADAVLDVKVALPGSGPILSGHSGGSATITATLSNFVSQLRINDIVEFSKQWCFACSKGYWSY